MSLTRQLPWPLGRLVRPASSMTRQNGQPVATVRAPVVSRVGPGPRILGKYNGDPVWVEEGRHMVTTFHPELTADLRVHRRFLDKIQG